MEESPTTTRGQEQTGAGLLEVIGRAILLVVFGAIMALFRLFCTPWGLVILVCLGGIITGRAVAASWGPAPGVLAGITLVVLGAAFKWVDGRFKEDYSQYVEHPRYGRGPRLNKTSPSLYSLKVRQSFSLFGGPPVIKGTAVAVDRSRLQQADYSDTHYFDLQKTCRDCQRPFIFFAEEQKHWHEELGLSMEVECVQCPICRTQKQTLKRYEVLYHVPERTTAQNLEMADCCLTLIEQGRFSPKKTELVRMLLRRIPETEQASETYAGLWRRTKEFEGSPREQNRVHSA